MGEKKWFWIRYDHGGELVIASKLYDSYEECFSMRESFKGERMCEIVWG